MSTIDIRDNEEITQIRFGDIDTANKIPDSIISCNEGIKLVSGTNQHGTTIIGSEVDDLILALKKAKELGWF